MIYGASPKQVNVSGVLDRNLIKNSLADKSQKPYTRAHIGTKKWSILKCGKVTLLRIFFKKVRACTCLALRLSCYSSAVTLLSPPLKKKTGRPQTTASRNTASATNTVAPPPPTPFYEKAQTYKDLQAQIAEKERLITQEPDLARQLSLSWEVIELEQEVKRYIKEATKLAELFTPVSNQSDRLCQAKLLFDEGRFCDADAVLSLKALLQEQSDPENTGSGIIQRRATTGKGSPRMGILHQGPALEKLLQPSTA